MRATKVGVVVVLAMAFASGAASAKGCVAGAAVGGVGGHLAGHHGLIGAAAGCAVGRHEANKKDRTDAAQNASHAPAASNTNQVPTRKE